MASPDEVPLKADETDVEMGDTRLQHWYSVVVRDKQDRTVNVKGNRYPVCLLWSPIPVLTWLLPFIGHVGCTSNDGH